MEKTKLLKTFKKLKYPASLTSQSEERVKEAIVYCQEATKGFGKNKKLLVLGCGDGYELEVLKGLKFQNVTGITLEDEEYASAKARGLNVIQADIHDLPFEDGEFDYVISKETLEHLLSPFLGLEEINRVMKRDGYFVHYIPCGYKKQIDWYHIFCGPPAIWLDWFHKTGFRVDSVYESIQQNRFSGQKIRDFDSVEQDLYDLRSVENRLCGKTSVRWE